MSRKSLAQKVIQEIKELNLLDPKIREKKPPFDHAENRVKLARRLENAGIKRGMHDKRLGTSRRTGKKIPPTDSRRFSGEMITLKDFSVQERIEWHLGQILFGLYSTSWHRGQISSEVAYDALQRTLKNLQDEVR